MVQTAIWPTASVPMAIAAIAYVRPEPPAIRARQAAEPTPSSSTSMPSPMKETRPAMEAASGSGSS